MGQPLRHRSGLVDEVLVSVGSQTNHRIVLVCDFSHGADALIASPAIASLKDLKGKRIGVETTALGVYMLARILDVAGLSAKEAQVVPIPLSRHVSARRISLEALRELKLVDRESNLRLLGDPKSSLRSAIERLSATMLSHRIIAEANPLPPFDDRPIRVGVP